MKEGLSMSGFEKQMEGFSVEEPQVLVRLRQELKEKGLDAFPLKKGARVKYLSKSSGSLKEGYLFDVAPSMDGQDPAVLIHTEDPKIFNQNVEQGNAIMLKRVPLADFVQWNRLPEAPKN